MVRTPTPELLDTDAGSPAEVASSLADLRRINRWLGGARTTADLVRKVAHSLGAARASLCLLEIAAGSGYVPRAACDRLARQGIRLQVTLLDRAASHLGASRRPGDGAVVADACRLPFRDASFDLVSSNLFLHHLAPDRLIACVRESLRVCRRAVLINDLIRHPLHLALVYAGMPLYRSRLTRHDAPASVRQAYTREEMLALLHHTGAARIEMESYYLFRMGVIVWKT
jgi:ubiquinone/menaquinone biosynthesis C-methylase UbiE